MQTKNIATIYLKPLKPSIIFNHNYQAKMYYLINNYY